MQTDLHPRTHKTPEPHTLHTNLYYILSHTGRPSHAQTIYYRKSGRTHHSRILAALLLAAGVGAGVGDGVPEDAANVDVPAGHSVHWFEPEDEVYDPDVQGWHVSQVLAPSLLENVPGGHFMQSEMSSLPEVSRNVPCLFQKFQNGIQ